MNSIKNSFKKKVKEVCMKYAFTKLMEIRSRHSKSKVAEYNKLETSGYLRSNIFTVTQSRLLFKIRSRMLDVKMNFKNHYNDDITLLICDQCNSGEVDDQSHILSCKVLENTKNITVKYSDLFSRNLKIVKKAIIEYEKSWDEMCTRKSSKSSSTSTNSD